MNFDDLIKKLVSDYGFVDNQQTFALRNAVRASLDAGVTADEVLGVASATRGDFATLSKGLSALSVAALASPETKKTGITTREASAGLPAGALGGPAGEAKRAPSSGGGAAAYINSARANPDNFNVFMDSNGRLHVQELGPGGGENVFITDESGNPVLYAKADSGSESAAASRFATSESSRQAELDRALREQERLDKLESERQSRYDTNARNAITDQQWNQSYNEGVRQFGVTADRNAFESDRSYQQAADQFATNFAQMQANIEYEAASNKTRFGMEAERFAAEQATADRRAALEEQKNRQDILRRPSDFINYAFQSRGKVAPTERITHADLINAASSEAAARQAASNEAVARLRGFAANAPTPRLVAPTVSPRLTAPVSAAPVVAPLVDTSFYAGQAIDPITGSAVFAANTPNVPTREQANRSLEAAFPNGLPPGVTRFATGTGMTRAPMFRVGEEPSGTPNDTEETIVNPTNAPLGVIKNPATVAQEDPVQKKRMASAAAIGRMMQHVEDPALQHALVDEAAKMKAGGQGMPRFALGTGQTLEQLVRAGQPVSQEDILSAAQQFAPPAITDLTSGRRISRFTPAFPSLTPRKVSMLTPSELTAADSYFGVVGNTTVADELAGIQSTFGPSVGRARSRFVSY